MVFMAIGMILTDGASNELWGQVLPEPIYNYSVDDPFL